MLSSLFVYLLYMNLWAFSVSLAVKDITASKAFYEKLWFKHVWYWSVEENRLIMKNNDHVIWLFQWMFEWNILTFNPWRNQDAEPLEAYTDIRDLQKKLKTDWIDFISEADEWTSGPASCTLQDPDGNVILIDQHV